MQGTLASTRGVKEQAVFLQLKSICIIQKQGNWDPYEIKPRDAERWFLYRQQVLCFWVKNKKALYMGLWHELDILWLRIKTKVYTFPERSLPSTITSTSKTNIHGSKIVLCIWWHQKGHCELRAVTTWRFHYVWAVQISSDSFKPGITGNKKQNMKMER